MALRHLAYPGFVGGAYRANVINTAADTCINLYKETVQTGSGINKSVLMGTPGISSNAFATLPGAGNVRGLWAGNDRLFAITLGDLYEVSSAGATTAIGSGMPTGVTPAQMYSNGNQLWCVCGGQTWIANGPAFTRPQYTTGLAGTVDTSGTNVGWASGDFFSPSMVGSIIVINGLNYTVASYISAILVTITLTAGIQVGVAYSAVLYVNAVSGTYLNGYFLALAPDSNQVNASNLLDGVSTWPDLDYAIRIQAQDRLMAIYAFNGNLWMLGQRTTEVWYPSGADGFPFSPISGGLISQGIWARNSVIDIDTPNGKALVWLSSNEQGRCQVVAAQGYGSPRVISTRGVEYAISQMATSSDASAWKYQEGGHSFYVLFFPSASQVWVYDATEDEWHQRQYYNGGSPTATLQWNGTMAFASGAIYVGAAASGKIWTQSLSLFTDDAGLTIHRERTAPSLSDDLTWTLYRYFQIDLQEGVYASSQSVLLSMSNDGGYTFGAAHVRTGGASGDYTKRVKFNQLGRSRKRVFKLFTLYNGQVQWANAYLGIEEGNGT